MSQNVSLKGKVAVVTGSTSGIGKAIAAAFAEAGADVMLNGLGTADDEINKAALKDVGAHGTRVSFAPVNLMKPEGARDLISRTKEEFGSVAILVNNAGMQHVAPIAEFPDERWDQIIALNLSASFHTIKAAIPHMRAGGFGRVINICSAHSLRASPNKVAYVAAKHGLAGMTKVVALETAEEPITVNAISPGYVWTPLVEQQIPDFAKSQGITEDEAKAQILDKQPSREFARSEQIGALALFLASDAAVQITGSNYTVDGGWTAQ
ncbi:MAG: 3-hydroxybutyrate dehydrogenase [Pseudomonadota bacterium]